MSTLENKLIEIFESPLSGTIEALSRLTESAENEVEKVISKLFIEDKIYTYNSFSLKQNKIVSFYAIMGFNN